VLGADVGPTRALIAAGRGWVVQPDDPDAYAGVLVDLVDDPSRCRAAGAAARAFACTRRWEGVWDALYADYLRLHAPFASLGRSLDEGGVTRFPSPPSAAALR
jgi:glycosyltransferase involved in cell wall biosynthesis